MIEESNMPTLSWSVIEQSIETLTKVAGGFSSAHRGIMTLPDGEKVFVKVGVDEATKKWAKKEVETYRFLQRNGYRFMPKLLACNEDETSLALEPLLPEAGWDWSDTWTEERLTKTLEAMDALAAIKPEGSDKDFFGVETLNESNDGWAPLRDSKELQQVLTKKLRVAGSNDLAENLDFAKEAARSASFTFRKDTLVHHDVRADNCSWNPKLQTVKLVDWNWTQLGDRRMDVGPTLVHVYKSGLNVLEHHADRLDVGALHWIAGFWFKAAATPIWPGGPAHLRDMQLRSGITALELADKVK